MCCRMSGAWSFRLMALFLVASLSLGSVQCVSGGLPISKLSDAIEAVISQPQFARMEWGILAEVRQANGSYEEIYSLNAEQFFTPASNMKVVTTAPAFLFLGEDYSTETPVWAENPDDDGNLWELCIEGRGDGSMDFAALQQIAEGAVSAGVVHVSQLVADDSWFPSFPGSWEWEDLVADYGAQPNSLVLSQNAFSFTVTPGDTVGAPVNVTFEYPQDAACITVVNTATTVASQSDVRQSLVAGYRIGDSRVHVAGQALAGQAPLDMTLAALQPAERFLCIAEYELEAAGITVDDRVIGECDNGEFQQLALLSGTTLSVMMNYTLQESDNLFAEGYLRHLGMSYDPLGEGEAQAKGIAAVQSILTDLGVDVTTFDQTDGSGLSRHNLLSPRAMAQILELMDETPNGDVYRSFLPVAGESGTLSNRFVGTPAQGVVEAKTGSMSGVNSLSGYVDARSDFPQMVFSILTNFSSQSSSTVQIGRAHV